MKETYNIFGSASSEDYDIMVFVDKLPSTIKESHDLIESFNSELSKIYVDKPVNCNMCTLKDGLVKETFKGTADEVNNSIFFTYHLHEQKHYNSIVGLIKRDVDLKLLRVFRIILSFLSRSAWRAEVKAALRGTLTDKIGVIGKIVNSLNYDFDLGNRNVERDDFFKILAFQIGQLTGLFNNKEYYTKEDIRLAFPGFANALDRKKLNEEDIEYLKKHLTQMLINVSISMRYEHLLDQNENTYESEYVIKKA